MVVAVAAVGRSAGFVERVLLHVDDGADDGADGLVDGVDGLVEGVEGFELPQLLPEGVRVLGVREPLLDPDEREEEDDRELEELREPPLDRPPLANDSVSNATGNAMANANIAHNNFRMRVLLERGTRLQY